jgi:hypothetical protein
MSPRLAWLKGLMFALALRGLLAPDAALAQGGSDGSIVGYVFDQAGNPIKGVKITGSSPTQIGGAKIAYTNDDGMFRLRQLFPGTFQVSAVAPKLKTVIQKDVRVGITSAAEVNLIMEVQTGATEQVTVVSRAPTVSTTTTNVKEVYDLDFVESMPFNSRDQVFNQMVGQIGGAVGTRVRGGAGNQTIFTQDGFDMRDQYPVTKASAAYEIQSAGYGADNATASGGIVNLVTKTGSNKWEFEFNATAENDTLRFGKDNRDSPGNYYYLVNPAVAGPIIKDKLWFAFAAEAHLLGRGREADVEGIRPTPSPHVKNINKGTLKITWQVTNRNKLTFLNNFDSAFNKNLKSQLGVEPEAQQNRKAGLSGLWGLIWETLLTDNLVFRSQVAYSRRPQYWYPSLCEGRAIGDCALEPGRINRYPRQVESLNVAKGCSGTGECSNGSAVPYRREDLDVWQAFNRLQWFVDSKGLGEHSLVLKHQFYSEKEVRKQAQPGDYYDEWNGDVPEARTTFYSNNPRQAEPRYGWWVGTDVIYRSNASFSDAWRPTRHFTLTPAISHIWTQGQNSGSDAVIDNQTWAPSVAAAWDATHDGRTVIRGSYSHYVDVAIRTPVLHTGGGPTTQRCLWNPSSNTYDRNCVYSGGPSRNTVGLPCGPTGFDGTGKSCKEKLGVPRTLEYTFGGEREITDGIALGMDLVYRIFDNQYEQRETNRIWNQAGTDLLGYRNGRNETVVDMGTPDGATRTYRGITASLNKRQGQLRTYVSYTLSQLRGTVFDGSDNPWGDIPGRDVYLDGPLPDDHLHDVKASMTYGPTSWLSFGARYNFASGFPYNHLYRNEVTGSYEDYRARRGINPGANINDPADDRELRLPNRQELNLQVRLNLLPLTGHSLAFYVDALNILNLRTATSYGQNDRQTFGVESGWLAPFRVRLGLDYRL